MMSQENSGTTAVRPSFSKPVNIIVRALPILFVAVLLISLSFTPWVYPAADETIETDRVQFQLKLTDLSSGTHLLRGRTLKSLENTYFGLIIVYKPEDAESELVETHNNIKVIEARDVNGTSLARVGSNTDSFVLTVDSDEFQAFIKERASIKNLYLVEQGSNIITATPASTPNPVFTPIPIIEGKVIFDLPASDTLKSDMNQFRAGDEVTIIISTQSIAPNGNTLERRSTPYAATIIGVLDNDYLTLEGPPYSNAKKLRISINRGSIIAFTNDLSGAVAIHLISRN